MVDRKRLPGRVWGLIVTLSIEVLHVEVLHIGKERGESPGDVFVVARDDEGQAGKSYAGCVEAGRTQVCHVPDVWLRELEMHVIGQQRLSARGMFPGDDPV